MLKAIVRGSNRYGLATLAPVAVSIAHFILQMAVLRVADKAVFGLLALILGFTQFGYGLSNALVSTPYTLDVNLPGVENKGRLVFFKTNFAFSLSWSLCCASLAIVFGHVSEAWLFGVFGFLAMVRWFGRAHLYAMHRPAQAAISDFVYASVLVAGLGVAWLTTLSFGTSLFLLALASLLGAVAIGREFLDLQFRVSWPAPLRPYAAIWRDQARWTLVGVICSEATSNAHAYAVSLIAGPAAFAPIAAATLLIRPISLAMTSLTQLERPVMVRQIAAGDVAGAARSAWIFRIAVAVVWAATTVAAVVVLAWVPRLLFKPSYDLSAVTMAFSLWSLISLLQCWSTPASVLLQACRWFRELARAGVISAVAATAAVVLATVLMPPVYSLCGILLGQVIMNRSLATLFRRWKHEVFPRTLEAGDRLPATGATA